MSFFSTIKKKTTLTAATNQIAKARKAEGGKADQLYKTAYEGFEFVLSDNLMLADALYNWGFGLLNQAKSKEGQEAIELYEEAINKYAFCLTIEPYYLGATVEGGVAYMDIARIKAVEVNDELYACAKKCFEQAGKIQKGSGAFNLACVYSVTGDNEGCLAALKEAKEFDHLPDEADILSDPDMENIINTSWFNEFMENIKAEKEAAIKAEAERKKAKSKEREATKAKVEGHSDLGDDSTEIETPTETANLETASNSKEPASSTEVESNSEGAISSTESESQTPKSDS